MKIDLTSLVTNISDSININEKVVISEDLLKNSNIRKLENVIFQGKIIKDYDLNLLLEGTISGIMILPDDITLEDTKYEFNNDLSENINEIGKIDKNTIDILDYLWQNILVEVPMKVHNPKNDNIHLEGDGWRLITEEEVNDRKNNPFSDLSLILEKGGKEDGSSI